MPSSTASRSPRRLLSTDSNKSTLAPTKVKNSSITFSPLTPASPNQESRRSAASSGSSFASNVPEKGYWTEFICTEPDSVVPTVSTEDCTKLTEIQGYSSFSEVLKGSVKK